MESKTPLANSLEAAKSGYQNAQEVVRFIDTKVGVALALLVFLIPAPLAFVGWQFGLEKSTSGMIWSGFDQSTVRLFLVSVGFLSLFGGGITSIISLIYGLNCVSPRRPKSHGKNGLFHNEWKPNVIFPMYAVKDFEAARKHFSSLLNGWDEAKILADYSDQLLEIGRILDEKLMCMRNCLSWLTRTLILYSLAAFMALAFLGLHFYWR